MQATTLSSIREVLDYMRYYIENLLSEISGINQTILNRLILNLSQL